MSQILPLVIRSKNVNYMIRIRCLVAEIKGKIRKRSMTFCTGVKFSKLSDFIENGLKLMRLICRFKKGIVCYTYDVLIKANGGVKGQRPDTT